ncbi:hypothetical protein KY329_04975 [Candidatus Woesearchaeota archaeon]|nr:hypothetical protein [Candidatus Woesearchaeota archaeon]
MERQDIGTAVEEEVQNWAPVDERFIDMGRMCAYDGDQTERPYSKQDLNYLAQELAELGSSQ